MTKIKQGIFYFLNLYHLSPLTNFVLHRYITADKFQRILSGVKLRRIPQYIKDNLNNVSNLNKGTNQEGKVSYAQFVACNDILAPTV